MAAHLEFYDRFESLVKKVRF